MSEEKLKNNKDMNNQLYLIVFFLTFALMACQPSKESQSSFELNGTIEGVSEGTILLQRFHFDGLQTDTAKIKDGVFQFKGDLPVPVQAQLMFASDGMRGGMLRLYVENSSISLTGKASDFRNATIVGSKSQDDYQKYLALSKPISIKRKKAIEEHDAKYESVTLEEQKQFDSLMLKFNEEYRLMCEAYIKNNPQSHYAAVLVTSDFRGMGADEMEVVLNGLEPEMKKNPTIVSYYERISRMRNVEVGFENIMEKASNVSYKVDEKFKGDKLKNIVYLSIFPNNNLCGLQNDGTILSMDTDGKVLKSFKPDHSSKATSITVDKLNRIYVLSALMKKETKKIRGKVHQVNTQVGVECTIFSEEGKQLERLKLNGIVSASGARVVDDKLIVSDCKTSKLAIFNANTGKPQAEIENMRSCCGILDFSVNNKKEILVANLGAFRVQSYDMNGKNIVSFGRRGKSLDDFHGCCNPVNVAYLSSGAIVTVEKSPTRIKVYSKEGAKLVEGIEELVKGCSYIPMTVDSSDNLYLASAEKGIVKCVLVK